MGDELRRDVPRLLKDTPPGEREIDPGECARLVLGGLHDAYARAA
jgi:hypothetical protein